VVGLSHEVGRRRLNGAAAVVKVTPGQHLRPQPLPQDPQGPGTEHKRML